jgi:hypothetical protein
MHIYDNINSRRIVPFSGIIQTDLDLWKETFFPSYKHYQFIDYRSAKEMAKFWLNVNNQNAIQSLIGQHINNYRFDFLIPEHKSFFDGKYSPREQDGFILDSQQETILTIEAKADEPFGSEPKYIFQGFVNNNIKFIENKGKIGRGATFREKIFEYWIQKNVRHTTLDKRLKKIYNIYFKGNSNIFNLEYQLTYWFAGTIYDSFIFPSIKNIILILQQFNHKSHDQNKILNNYNEYLKLVKILSGNNTINIPMNSFVGPFNNIYSNGKNIYFGYLYRNI